MENKNILIIGLLAGAAAVAYFVLGKPAAVSTSTSGTNDGTGAGVSNNGTTTTTTVQMSTVDPTKPLYDATGHVYLMTLPSGATIYSDGTQPQSGTGNTTAPSTYSNGLKMLPVGVDPLTYYTPAEYQLYIQLFPAPPVATTLPVYNIKPSVNSGMAMQVTCSGSSTATITSSIQDLKDGANQAQSEIASITANPNAYTYAAGTAQAQIAIWSDFLTKCNNKIAELVACPVNQPSPPNPSGQGNPPPAPLPNVVIPFNWSTFDWVGGQNDGSNHSVTGIHLDKGMPFGVKKGDTVVVNVLSGDQSYNGEATVLFLGADDGTYKDSMITINKPKVGAASGQIRLKSASLSADGSNRIY